MASKIIVDQLQKSGYTTLTLPSANATANQILKNDGTGSLSWAEDTGKILKVYETNLNTTVTTTSTSYVASGLQIITDAPASTSSRFLLTLMGGKQLGTTAYGYQATTFYVGGVEVADTGPYEEYMYHVSTQKDAHSAQMIHSPASVTAQTYAVFYKMSLGTGSFNVSPVRVVFTVTEIGV